LKPGALRAGLVALLTAWVWVAGFSPSTKITTPPEALALARCFEDGLRAGVEYVYTFGPLGAFHTESYTPGLFWRQVLLWEGALKLLIAVVLVQVGLKIPGRIERVLFFVLLAYPISIDAYAYVSILGVLVWMLERERLSPWITIAGSAVLAAFGLAKFSFLAPALVSIVAVGAGSPRRMPAVGATFVAVLVALWWVAGQDLRDLPTWFHRSLQVSTGYGEGCGTPAPSGLRPLAFATAGLVAVQCAGLFRAESDRRKRRLLACAVPPILWIAYKAGFVRAADHTSIYFGFTMLAPFLLASGLLAPGVIAPGVRWGLLGRLACIALSFAATTLVDPADETWGQRLTHATKTAVRNLGRNVGWITDLGGARAECESRHDSARAEVSLPRTRAAVGDRPIDVISYQQQVLLLNDLAWRPRPVFQGYVALGPELQKLNAGFLESDRAPEFVLFHLETIDGRLPAMDDALALQVVARDYEAVLAESGFLLLRRNPREAATDEVVIERTLAFGETLDLSGLEGSCHVLELDVPASLLVRLRTLLESAPPLAMEIGLDSGRTAEVRIVPAMMRSGVVLDPFLGTQRDWIAWYTGQKLERPVRLKIIEPRSPALCGETIVVRVLRRNGIAPRVRTDLAAEALFSLFKTRPSDGRAALPFAFGHFLGTEVLLSPAPSEISFGVTAGAHTLRGRYGILPRNWQSGRTGGAVFSAVLRIPGREDVLVFEKLLDPTGIEADRRLRFLEVPFDAPAAGALLLRTEPGPGPGPCRETAWTAVEVE